MIGFKVLLYKLSQTLFILKIKLLEYNFDKF